MPDKLIKFFVLKLFGNVIPTNKTTIMKTNILGGKLKSHCLLTPCLNNSSLIQK